MTGHAGFGAGVVCVVWGGGATQGDAVTAVAAKAMEATMVENCIFDVYEVEDNESMKRRREEDEAV